jgi:signal peptidase II
MAVRNRRAFIILAILVAVVDQVTKLLATYFLSAQSEGGLLSFAARYFTHFWEFPYSAGQPLVLWAPWIKLGFTTNTGMAWGMLHGHSLLLSFVSLVLVGVICLIWSRYGRRSVYLTVSLGLILGGALGNMIDRFRLQEVVDFVDVLIPVFNYDFPVFNFADACASVGTILVAVYLIASDVGQLRRRSVRRYDLTSYLP